MVKTSGPGGGGSTQACMLSTVMMSCSTYGVNQYNQVDYYDEKVLIIANIHSWFPDQI